MPMQPAPPVPDLIRSLELFASRVEDLLTEPDIDWRWRPDADSWSLGEVMCHLRDVERDVHLERYHTVISEDKPFISGVDSDNWAAVRKYRSQNGREAARSFLLLRKRSIDLLRELDYQQWERTANHAFFGTTTLHELINLAVQHDDAHWHQIKELLPELK
jgi:hypothetical protein